MARDQVLIVDDDLDLAESIADYVAMHGHAVTIASNGKEAVDRFRRSDFDIAFMDVRMPVMNGVDSFMEIRSFRPEPIVQKALDSGAIGLLQKPFEATDLLANLEQAIGG